MIINVSLACIGFYNCFSFSKDKLSVNSLQPGCSHSPTIAYTTVYMYVYLPISSIIRRHFSSAKTLL